MISNDEKTTKYNIKINCNLEELKEKLSNFCYKNTNSYYKLNIYMIPDNINILEIDDLSFLELYAIIQDFNGSNKQIVHKDKNAIIAGQIDNVIAIKSLLEKLNYNELMYINYDVYCYNKNGYNIEIKDIFRQGLFIEGTTDILKFLEDLNISYDIDNLYIDNEKIALNNIQRNIKNNIN